jgi:hypothetical protein
MRIDKDGKMLFRTCIETPFPKAFENYELPRSINRTSDKGFILATDFYSAKPQVFTASSKSIASVVTHLKLTVKNSWRFAWAGIMNSPDIPFRFSQTPQQKILKSWFTALQQKDMFCG